MGRLADGTIKLESQTVANASLLPRAWAVPEHLHIVFNALEEARKSTEAWPIFEPLRRELVNFAGDKKLRDPMFAANKSSGPPDACFARLLFGVAGAY